MNLNFIGVNEKIVNLDAIALIEDVTGDGVVRVLLTTNAGVEIELVGSDAEIFLQRAEMMLEASDALAARIATAAAQPTGAPA